MERAGREREREDVMMMGLGHAKFLPAHNSVSNQREIISYLDQLTTVSLPENENLFS